jgi:hypothetical protein
MATRYQQLGAYVVSLQKLGYADLQKFHTVGGRWIAPIIQQVGYPPDHDPQCVTNRSLIPQYKAWCDEIGIALGGWFMCWDLGGAEANAAEIEMYVRAYDPDLMPVVLNCELAYKARPNALPELIAAYRRRIKTLSTFLSVIDLNDSMIYNGGGGVGCARACNIRVSPQWYSAPKYQSMWFDPYKNLAWLKERGTEGNLRCLHVKDHRAVPNSWVKGTVEATGVEGASMQASLDSLSRAKADKLYDFGLSVFTLDSMPPEDYDRLAAVRGKLFLV